MYAAVSVPTLFSKLRNENFCMTKKPPFSLKESVDMYGKWNLYFDNKLILRIINGKRTEGAQRYFLIGYSLFLLLPISEDCIS